MHFFVLLDCRTQNQEIGGWHMKQSMEEKNSLVIGQNPYSQPWLTLPQRFNLEERLIAL